jgi:hypothetical protein
MMNLHLIPVKTFHNKQWDSKSHGKVIIALDDEIRTPIAVVDTDIFRYQPYYKAMWYRGDEIEISVTAVEEE